MMRRLSTLDEFSYLMTQILDAGISENYPQWGIWPNPYFVLFDREGKPWPQWPCQMGRADILRYVGECWPQFLDGVAKAVQLTVH